MKKISFSSLWYWFKSKLEMWLIGERLSNNHWIPYEVVKDIEESHLTNLNKNIFREHPTENYLIAVFSYKVLTFDENVAKIYITKLANLTENRIDFYYQCKYLMAMLLEDLTNPENQNEKYYHIYNGMNAVKKSRAKYNASEILLWIKETVEKQEEEYYKTFLNAAKNDMITWIGDKKDFVMWALMPVFTHYIQIGPRYSKKGLAKDLANYLGIPFSQYPDSLASKTIDKGSYHRMIDDLLKMIKKYKENFETKIILVKLATPI